MSVHPTLDAALQYAGRGWPVFPVSFSKIPFKGSRGFHDASTDPTIVTQLFQNKKRPNVALATGRIVVFDCDGQAGLDRFLALGRGPQTLVSRTPSGGWHFFYYAPKGVTIRTRAERRADGTHAGLDIKAQGGFVLLPPSRTAKGAYSWANDVPIIPLPDHLLAACEAGNRTPNGDLGFGPMPAFLVASRLPETQRLSHARLVAGEPWTAHEEARLRAALRVLQDKAIGYSDWMNFGFAIHELNWGGTGFNLWNQWSSVYPRYSLAECEAKWESMERSNYSGQPITVATIFRLAQDAGWDGRVEQSVNSAAVPDSDQKHPPGDASGFGSGAYSPPPINGAKVNFVASSIVFPDTDKRGRPRATARNAYEAIRGLGLHCQKDLFHDRITIEGYTVQENSKHQISDDVVLGIRNLILKQYRLDAGTLPVNDALIWHAQENAFHPIKNYFASLQWDGRARLDKWLSTYLGAPDTELNRQFGKLILLAAVRRIRQPGCKFDEILVLEGPEGQQKSSAIRVLAGPENFGDQSILTMGEREQQEALQGRVLYEIADLSGIRRADDEKVKTFASRTMDSARPAYGRHRVDRPRQCVFFGTTNNKRYLQSQTGNRRWWPVSCGTIVLAQLEADRDQLWAEACLREARGESIRLDAKHWCAAGELQQTRTEEDPWLDVLVEISEEKIATNMIFSKYLQMSPDKMQRHHTTRLAQCMEKLGWEGPKTIKMGEKTYKGYFKGN